MKNLPIVGKFLTVFALFGVFALGIAAYSSNSIMSIDSAYSDLITHESAAALSLARANRTLQNGRAGIADLMISFTDEANKAAVAEVAASRTEFVEQMDEAIRTLPSNASLTALKASGLAIYDVTCTNAIALGKSSVTQDDNKAAQRAFLDECKPGFAAIGPQFVTVTNDVAHGAIVRSDELTGDSTTTARTTVAAVITGFLIIAGIGFVAVRKWVVTPVRALATTMTTLAEGNLTASVDGTDRRDEVGGMARAVQVFKDNGLKARTLEAEADRTRNASEAERERVAASDRQRAAEMTQATQSLADGLRRLSAGDLTVHLDQAFAVDFEGLRADFNAAVAQLRETLSAVSHAVGAIDGGSRELSESASDLSRRTEQQAASLEETAAALDEITANVSNSAKRTEEARTVAIAANESAQQSGRVVADAVDAMERIESSSSQISNIIGVIDEIAFQTNLLALNAGVEAARAGEAGKGFAVVAQEVRELAQRSANAAKEIKGLIRHSAGEVEGGVRHVKATGEALKVIESHIVSINSQLDAISTSAREQSVGLAEVNTAVNQMDQVTQQNAAMVEEATAASSSLATEADRLRQLIHRFQLGQGGAATTRARPTVAPAAATSQPAASPARRMMNKVASAFGGGAAAAASVESWEEF